MLLLHVIIRREMEEASVFVSQVHQANVHEESMNTYNDMIARSTAMKDIGTVCTTIITRTAVANSYSAARHYTFSI